MFVHFRNTEEDSTITDDMLFRTLRLDRRHADTPYSASLLEHKYSGKSQRYLTAAWHFVQGGPLFCQNSDSDDNNRETAAAADVHALRRVSTGPPEVRQFLVIGNHFGRKDLPLRILDS